MTARKDPPDAARRSVRRSGSWYRSHRPSPTTRATPSSRARTSVWRRRYETINEFEQMLSASSTAITRFLLYIAKDEQKRRLESRLRNPEKHWKFSSADVGERAFRDEYQAALEDALGNCSTAHGPWYVVPANHKWYRNLVVARITADTLETMNPQFPPAEEGPDKVVIPHRTSPRLGARGSAGLAAAPGRAACVVRRRPVPPRVADHRGCGCRSTIGQRENETNPGSSAL